MEITKENWRDLVDCLTKRVDLPLQAWFNWDEALMVFILDMNFEYSQLSKIHFTLAYSLVPDSGCPWKGLLISIQFNPSRM